MQNLTLAAYHCCREMHCPIDLCQSHWSVESRPMSQCMHKAYAKDNYYERIDIAIEKNTL